MRRRFAEMNLERDIEEKNRKEEADRNLAQLISDFYVQIGAVYEPNATINIDGYMCKTDDQGRIYEYNGEIIQNSWFVLDGLLYTTDEHGNVH